jgi:ribosome-associated protein
MKAPTKDDSQDTNPDAEPLSKTQRKAAMDDLQDIGVKLIDLPKDKLIKLNLPERLLDAVQEAKRITANGAKKRQKQYIGSLMREVDAAPIIDQLQRWEGKHTAEAAHFHQLERWRDRLLNEESALSEFIQLHPSVDSQQLRTLIRNSQREAAANKPPKSSRELFRLLREITTEVSPSQ